MSRRFVGAPLGRRRRSDWHGQGLIGGTLPNGGVTIDGAAGRALVRVMLRATGQLVEERLSGADGAFAFPYLDDTQLWVVLALDPDRQHNAAVADLIVPFVAEG